MCLICSGVYLDGSCGAVGEIIDRGGDPISLVFKEQRSPDRWTNLAWITLQDLDDLSPAIMPNSLTTPILFSPAGRSGRIGFEPFFEFLRDDVRWGLWLILVRQAI